MFLFIKTYLWEKSDISHLHLNMRFFLTVEKKDCIYLKRALSTWEQLEETGKGTF